MRVDHYKKPPQLNSFALFVRKVSTSIILSLGPICAMYGMGNIMLCQALEEKGVVIARQNINVLILRIEQQIQEQQGARASSSAMSVDISPLY